MEEELKEICHKMELTKDDLDNIYKIVDIIKDITTIDAMLKSDANYSHSRGKDEKDNLSHSIL